MATTGGLDSDFPYPYGYWKDADGTFHNVTTNYTWLLPQVGFTADNPVLGYKPNDVDNGGAGWYQASIDESFKTFIKYQPPKVGDQGVVWVPLASMNWSWTDDASKVNGAWVQDDELRCWASDEDITATDDPPQWTQVILNGAQRP